VNSHPSVQRLNFWKKNFDLWPEKLSDQDDRPATKAAEEAREHRCETVKRAHPEAAREYARLIPVDFYMDPGIVPSARKPFSERRRAEKGGKIASETHFHTRRPH